MQPSFAGFSGNSFYHVLPIPKRPRPLPPLRRPSITTTLFSPRPVKVRRPSAPLTSKPIYTTVGQQPQSSNQKIEIENFSHTASLLRGEGKLFSLLCVRVLWRLHFGTGTVFNFEKWLSLFFCETTLHWHSYNLYLSVLKKRVVSLLLNLFEWFRQKSTFELQNYFDSKSFHMLLL